MSAELLKSYINGNYRVQMFSDGTKRRLFNDKPNPLYPESLDVQITNWCDAGCGFCHEMSTTNEPHGDLNLGMRVLSGLPAGTELALGGGATQKHPDLLPFLEDLSSLGLIVNMTVNSFHVKKDLDLLSYVRNKNLIYGLGLSYLEKFKTDLLEFSDENTVVHMIIGVHSPEQLWWLMNNKKTKLLKVLLLGYKTFGRGEDYYNSHVDERIKSWYISIKEFFKTSGLIISFDNLAIKQLNIRRFFTENSWNNFYMGNDGHFTMYMSLVKKEFSVSSTSVNRFPIREFSIIDMFNFVKKESGAYGI